jgi:hypothetical protein
MLNAAYSLALNEKYPYTGIEIYLFMGILCSKFQPTQTLRIAENFSAAGLQNLLWRIPGYRFS